MDRVELARLLGASTIVAEPRNVVVEASEPERFIAAFAGAVAAGGTVFLADPAWEKTERAQFNALVTQPSVPCGESSKSGWLCIPTGGSSGAIKLARHDEETLSGAVRGFCGHFGIRRVNAIGLLPLHHVSGFMAWMRTVLTGGRYLQWSWKALESGERPALPAGEGDWFLSLVPTQLQRLLADPEAVDWMRGFRAVFVGGGPAWPELVEAGARARLPLAFAYGMTETAAMVTALQPEIFLAGARGSGTPMPHVRITLDDDGRIIIGGDSLFRGYWPKWRTGAPWPTEDMGKFDERGSLHVLGRRDALIITGGEKVDPAEVESALRATGAFDDIAVIGVPNPEWGEEVVAFYPSSADQKINSPSLDHLAVYKRPKRYVAVADWPRNAQGKVNRAELRRLASA